MKAPLSWVREFTPVDAPAEEIAHTLSFLGLVVERTEVYGPPLPGIVAARVLSTRPHPAADRIQLVEVDAGDGEALQICCGAFNMKAGDLVPLATLGTVMPSGIEIGRRKMRGEWSNGMLCSAPELGIGPEGPAPAIYLLAPGSAEPGQPVAEVLGLGQEVVFDIDVSPNRPDCFSIAGIARDLAAALRLPFQLPSPPRAIEPGVPAANVAVESAAAALCPRFTGTIIENIGAATVPFWVGRRLALCGMRPINPVVDVSNYVMLELGQPNHPYDLERLGGAGLLVRRAAAGEETVTLDGATRRLGPDDCVIADAQGHLVGIAGIMGGKTAEISEQTSAALLEMANFDATAVAATGKSLGLLSEARTRFERGVDVELPDLAIDRFVQLLGGAVRRGPTTDVRAPLPPPVPVPLRPARANLVLGTSLSADQCAELLAPLGFRPAEGDVGDDGPGSTPPEGELRFWAPTWRPDCDREVDLIEEVARIYGYDKIARLLPPRPLAAGGLTAYQKGRRATREILVGSGVTEIWGPSFCSAQDIARSGLSPAAALELENPLDQSQGLLRTSLLPGLLSALRSNRERQAGALSLFEVGNVFSRPPHLGLPTLVPGVVEAEQMAMVATGGGAGAAHAVAAWEVLCEGLRLQSADLVALAPPNDDRAQPASAASALAIAPALHPGRRSVVMAGGLAVGVVGEAAPEVAEAYGFEGPVSVLALDLGPLLASPRREWRARPVSRYPASDLDMAFVVNDDVPAGAVVSTVRRAAGDLAETVALFDVWRGPSLGGGRRSLAFRARLRAPDRTLTDAEVADVREQVAAAALAEHGAVLRAAP